MYFLFWHIPMVCLLISATLSITHELTWSPKINNRQSEVEESPPRAIQPIQSVSVSAASTSYISSTTCQQLCVFPAPIFPPLDIFSSYFFVYRFVFSLYRFCVFWFVFVYFMCECCTQYLFDKNLCQTR